MSTPWRAACAMPASTVAGVPSASAHGEAATSRVIERRNASRSGTPNSGGTIINSSATPMTAGTNTRENRSTVCCVGDFCAWASSTMCMTRARVLSPTRRVTWASSAPFLLMVPA